jgi:hypothetical protein
MRSVRLENTFDKRIKITPRRDMRSVIAFVAIWSISLLVLLFGLPVIIYQAITRRNED